MTDAFQRIAPRFAPPLDPGFRPAVLANRAFRAEVEQSGAGVPLRIALARPDGTVSRFDTVVFAAGHARAAANLTYVERLVKFMLWSRGGHKVWIGGPASVGEHIAKNYAATRARAFDAANLLGSYPISDNGAPTDFSQRPLSSPTVFNFFLPDHQPTGPIADADLFSPEFQIVTTVTAITSANALRTQVDRTMNNDDNDALEVRVAEPVAVVDGHAAVLVAVLQQQLDGRAVGLGGRHRAP